MNLVNHTSKILLFLLLVILQSCNTKKLNNIQEGVIKYKITYLKDKQENPLISLLPEQTYMYFGKNHTQFIITGWMGVFESRFIKNDEDNEMIIALKMLNKKYYYRGKELSDFMGIGTNKNNNWKISFDKKTKQILDYECNHALIIDTKNNLTFDLYYTEEIGNKNPNLNTFYEPIKGTLMELQLEVNGIPMLLEANDVIPKEIPTQFFSIPKDYIKVKKQFIDSIFLSIM